MSRPAGAGRGDRPNILVLMTDQQRWDALGSVSSWVETPNLDAVAARGVRFANAYTQAPECIPARVGLALSDYPHNTKVWSNRRYTLPRDSDTWMRALRDAGYHTSVFGKTHLHPHVGDIRDRRDLVESYGLEVVTEITGPRAARVCRSELTDAWEAAGVYELFRKDIRERYSSRPWLVRPTPLPFDLYPDVWIARKAIEHLDGYDDVRPWMCWVSFPGPHEPWDTPEPYAGRYRPEDMPAATQFDRVRRRRRDGKPPRGRLQGRLEHRPRGLSKDDIARIRADYAGHVTLIDDQIGELLAAVERRGEADNTVVVLIADHGELNGDFGLIYKSVLLGPAVRIPMVIAVPQGLRGGTSGAVADTVVELTDIGPTLLDLAGAGEKFGRGASLVPVLETPGTVHRDVALSGFRHEWMATTPSWKIAVNRQGTPYLLFDLENDPYERRNLAGMRQYRDVEEQLLSQLQQRVGETRGHQPTAARAAGEAGPSRLTVLHIGKTGGTAIKLALRRDLGLPDTPFGRTVVTTADSVKLRDIPKHDYVMFVVRDPIARFASAFYSRYRKGQPRYYFEWNERERIAFERFPTPQALADGLGSDDRETRQAAERAMKSIRHTSRLSRWLGGPRELEKRADKIVYIGRQETLDADWQHIRRVLQLPDDAGLPDDPVAAHRGDPNTNRTFSAEQEAALRRWYAKDYQILEFCDRLRAERGWGVPIDDAPPPRKPPAEQRPPSLPTGPVTTDTLRALIAQVPNRFRMWTTLLEHIGATSVAEIGVLNGNTAVDVLTHLPDLARFYVVEGGADLGGVRRAPGHDGRDLLDIMFDQAVSRVSYFGDRVSVLRGANAAETIPDASLDFFYLGEGADHTLAGVTADLAVAFEKVRDGGFVGGDDFAESVWVHGRDREPTVVFPYAVQFARDKGVRVYALPYRQFLLHKDTRAGYEFIDLTGAYDNLALDLDQQLARPAPQPRTPTQFERLAELLERRLRSTAEPGTRRPRPAKAAKKTAGAKPRRTQPATPPSLARRVRRRLRRLLDRG